MSNFLSLTNNANQRITFEQYNKSLHIEMSEFRSKKNIFWKLKMCYRILKYDVCITPTIDIELNCIGQFKKFVEDI